MSFDTMSNVFNEKSNHLSASHEAILMGECVNDMVSKCFKAIEFTGFFSLRSERAVVPLGLGVSI